MKPYEQHQRLAAAAAAAGGGRQQHVWYTSVRQVFAILSYSSLRTYLNHICLIYCTSAQQTSYARSPTHPLVMPQSQLGSNTTSEFLAVAAAVFLSLYVD